MMSEKRKKLLLGILLLLAGAALIVLGGMKIRDLITSRAQAGDFVGGEVPRELIESAYGMGTQETQPPASTAESDLTVFLPAQATPEALPTLPTLDPTRFGVTARPTPEIDAPQPGDLLEREAVEPRWIYIKKIGLDAPVIPATSTLIEVEEDDKTYELVQWEAPNEFAAGWHSDSAPLGQPGNTVINGHHNVYGKVFGQLVYLQEGDLIQIYGSDGQWYYYAVANKMVLPETGVSLQKRMENAAWLLPSNDERLTLLTCWPEQTNTHRLILVASPVHIDESMIQTVTPTAAPSGAVSATGSAPLTSTP